MANKLLIPSLTLVSLVFLAGCVSAPAPIEEYALARAAIEAARSVESARYSAGYWHQADEAYRRAIGLFKNQDFAEAREQFIRAKVAAEKAENSARLIRQKNGEVL